MGKELLLNMRIDSDLMDEIDAAVEEDYGPHSRKRSAWVIRVLKRELRKNRERKERRESAQD